MLVLVGVAVVVGVVVGVPVPDPDPVPVCDGVVLADPVVEIVRVFDGVP